MPRLAVAIFVAAIAAARAQAQAPRLPSDDSIRAIAAHRVATQRHPGIVIGIVQGGRPRIFTAGSAGPGRPALDGTTLFEIGSVTKTFTALLLAEMALRGEVRLDQPVEQLVTRGTIIPARGAKITLEHLATHRSGLPSLPTAYWPSDPDDPYADLTAARLFAFLSTYALPREPGARFEYSNIGMGLLGIALARRGGADYERVLDRRVLQPLGLRETGIVVPPSLQGRLAAGHDRMGDAVAPWYLPEIAGAGALRASANDVLRYVAANIAASTSSRLGRAMLLTHQPHARVDAVSQTGLGWQVRRTPRATIVWHGGATAGFRSFVGFDRARGIGVVVLANSGTPNDDIGLHLLDPDSPLAPPPVPPKRPIASLTLAQLDALVGVYRLAPTFAIEVTRLGDRLIAQATNQPRFRMWPESPTRFFVKEVDAQLSFELDTAGRATRLTLHQNGQSIPGPRER